MGLLYYGPLIWPIENEIEFTVLVVSYHLAFAAGYISFMKIFGKNLRLDSASPKVESFFIDKFWFIIVGALVAILISHRNIVHSDSYIPWTIFSDLQKGFENAALVRNYYASAEYAEKFRGNSLVSSLLLFFSVFKYAVLPGLIILWDKLPNFKKVIGFLVAVMPLATGICMSISAVSFVFIFVATISLGVLVLRTRSFAILKKRLVFVFFLIGLSLFSFLNFYHIKTGTTFMKVATGKATPSRFDYLRDKGVIFKSDLKGEKVTAVVDLYEKLTVYLVNGYFGMSLALDEEFESSYGVGHSVFLQKTFDNHLGTNFEDRSFQHKISHRWDKNVLWHSAYSYFANDVSFAGVVFVMFTLGFFLGMCVWASVLEGNLIASSLIPLFGIMVLYFPANNQVFGFLETMSSFWILAIAFILLRFPVKGYVLSKRRHVLGLFSSILRVKG